MAILSDQDLIHRLERGTLRIDPFRERNLTPNGYDLTVSEVYFRSPEGKVTIGAAYLDPGSWCLISTREYLEMSTDLVGMLWLRSTYVRKGLVAGFGLVDAGFKGTLTFSLGNLGPDRVSLPVGERICQISYEELTMTPKKLYGDRSGTYQGQAGVTLDGGRKT